VPSGEQRYYDGLLYLMSMMHAGGEFKIIASSQQPAASSQSPIADSE